MTHLISFEDWIDYADGTMEPGKAAALKIHADTCQECQDLLQSLTEAASVLAAAAEAGAKSEWLLDAGAIASAKQSVLARIRQEPAYVLESVPEEEVAGWRLGRLQSAVGSICGAQTATQIVMCALQASRRRPAEEPGRWAAFLQSLHDLTDELCGATPARLLLAYGETLE